MGEGNEGGGLLVAEVLGGLEVSCICVFVKI